MNFIPSFFKFDPSKLSSIPTVEPKSAIEKAIDKFLNTKLDDITTAQLDKLATTILENPFNLDSFDAPALYELYIKNQKTIEQLLTICKLQQNPTSKFYQSFEKNEKIIQALLTMNETLVNSSSRFSEEELIKSSIEAGKLLETVKPGDLKKWSEVTKVTDARFERINKNRNAKKIPMTSFHEYKIGIEQILNLLREIQPPDKNKTLRPKF